MAKQEIIRAVKGTRDYYPEDMAIRTWLYGKIRQISESFGYSEYEAPLLETLNLYAAKSGEEIVEKQSYVFADRSGERIALRPELTPSLARMIAARQQQLTFPLRWWSFGPFWRYERPQKGRTREFFQWNIDMIGDDSPEADAELIAIAANFFKLLNLQSSEVQILVNDRRLMDKETLALGIDESKREEVYQLIDRKDKMDPDKWDANAADIGLNNKQISGIKEIITNNQLWEKSNELKFVFKALEAYGVNDYVQYAPHIIRGLAYYTGTVFEAWDTSGEFRALFGGGRYDNLVGDVGGQAIGSVGFAVGDLVITLLLKSLNKLPQFKETPAEIFITTFDEDHLIPALELGNELRSDGLRVTNHLKPEKLSKQFKYASKIGAKLVLILGPEEISNNQISIKNLESGKQESVGKETCVNRIREFLEAKES
ncbi:MAG: histidine--tRNA ligase [Anaerolineales bacterium]